MGLITATAHSAFAGDALAALHRLVGRTDVDFHDGQREAIEALVQGGERVLVVQRTGWGKSAVYFVATALLRARGRGPTIIVSPLLALMRDQIAAAQRAGIRARTMNSANVLEWDQVRGEIEAGAVDVLLVSPERLANPAFRVEVLPHLAAACGLLVVDEAHCVSDWGHDFRPDYRRIKDLLTELPDGIPVLATTATANARVVTDVAEQLQAGSSSPVRVIRGPLARDSLRLAVLPVMGGEQRLAWLLTHLPELPGSGIIYTLTVSAAEDVAQALTAAGLSAAAYTGRTDPAEREALEDALRRNEVKALVATSALGMGFDKPDLGFVVHLGAPSSPIAYYQQVGRAGRATERADVVLLPGPEDREIWTYFASVSMPREDQAAAVLRALEVADGPLSSAALEAAVDVRRTRLELLLSVLAVDGAVERVRGGWVGTGAAWDFDARRYRRVAATRAAEEQLMLDYISSRGCRMELLGRALDDPTAHPCGRCDTCAGPWIGSDADATSLAAAAAELARPGVAVEPRAMWPTGMAGLGVPLAGRIPVDARVQAGRAVARLTDLGWGSRLREVFAGGDGPVPVAIVSAVVEVLAGWGWADRPVAVVSMPSRTRPVLIRSLAEQIGALGRLEDLGSLSYSDPAPPQLQPGSSAFRLAGLHDRLLVPDPLRERLVSLAQERPGPVLLVDDLVSSRWTLTVAGAALRSAGASAVLPLALAIDG